MSTFVQQCYCSFFSPSKSEEKGQHKVTLCDISILQFEHSTIKIT